MVLQVPPYRGDVRNHRNAVPAELVRRADAGEHQDMRRIERAARQNDFPARRHPPVLSAATVADTHGAAVFDHDAVDVGLGLELEVGPGQSRPQERVRRAPAPSVVDILLHAADAHIVAAVEIVKPRQPDFPGGLHDRLDHRVPVGASSDTQRAPAAPAGALPALPGFAAVEIGKNVGVRPSRQTGLRPAVVVRGVTPYIGHGVYRGAPADDPGANAFQDAAVGLRFGLGVITPVVMPLVDELLHPHQRHLDPRVVVHAAGLEHQNPDIGILGQPVGQHATRRSRADDYVVEFLPGHLKLLPCAGIMARRVQR